jgi:hypothetical protein
MQDLASGEHAKVLSLQQENERLRAQKDQFEAMKTEVQRLQGIEQEVEHFRRSMDVNPRDLETFITNKTAIRHYLKLVPMLLGYFVQSNFSGQITHMLQAEREDAEATCTARLRDAPRTRAQL